MTVTVTYQRGTEAHEDKYEGVNEPAIVAKAGVAAFLRVSEIGGRVVADYPIQLVIKVAYTDNRINVVTH